MTDLVIEGPVATRPAAPGIAATAPIAPTAPVAPIATQPRKAPSVSTRSVCIDGWRGVNHSIAMVNQHQLLALLDQPGLRLFHRDMPYFRAHWTAKLLPAGFSTAQQGRIDAVPAPAAGQALDCVFRITSPFLTHFTPGQKTLSFMVTECSLVDVCFDAPVHDRAAFTREANRIVTPSHWARDRLVEYGFDATGIDVLPHGVNAETFAPLRSDERALARQQLGIAEDETLFVNVGVATWNKGLDLLITAFARVRQAHPRARLLIKENRSLYGVGVDSIVAEVQRKQPKLLDSSVLAGISILSDSLGQQQLRTLYAVADAYVSPYRAEGFNLPVLEAMACGTPVIVTDGGATDDFCPDALATRVMSRPGGIADAPQDVGPFRVPDADALVAAMAAVVHSPTRRDDALRLQARETLVARHTWASVARQLARLM